MSKGFLTYPKFFRRYKVNGVMAKFTLYQKQTSSMDPLLGWMIPYGPNDGAPTVVMQNANTIKSQRHTAWSNVKNWGGGGGPTTLKKFFKMKTLTGNKFPNTDLDYTSFTDSLGNPYNTPPETWLFYAGICTVNQLAMSSTESVDYNLELTYYVEFWEQVNEQQNL